MTIEYLYVLARSWRRICSRTSRNLSANFVKYLLRMRFEGWCGT